MSGRLHSDGKQRGCSNADRGQTSNTIEHRRFHDTRRYQRVIAAVIATTYYIHVRGTAIYDHEALWRVVGCGLESSSLWPLSGLETDSFLVA